MLPDSPRYLASVGRNDEALELLTLIRGHKTTPVELEHEYLEIIATTRDSKQSSPIQFAMILVGKGGRPGSSLSRRAWLCLFLQVMASWTGITVHKSPSMEAHGQALVNNTSRQSLLTHLSFSARLDTVRSHRMALQGV